MNVARRKPIQFVYVQCISRILLHLLASSADDLDRKSMEDSARSHTERGVSDICLTESQQGRFSVFF